MNDYYWLEINTNKERLYAIAASVLCGFISMILYVTLSRGLFLLVLEDMGNIWEGLFVVNYHTGVPLLFFMFAMDVLALAIAIFVTCLSLGNSAPIGNLKASGISFISFSLINFIGYLFGNGSFSFSMILIFQTIGTMAAAFLFFSIAYAIGEFLWEKLNKKKHYIRGLQIDL